MNTILRFMCIITLVTTLCSCSGTSGGGDEITRRQFVTETPLTLPVRMLIVTRVDGSGNPLWSRGYVEELLDTASAQVGHTVLFTLASYEVVVSESLYTGNQGALLAWLAPQAQAGILTVAISRPDTEDSAGQSVQAIGLGRHAPTFVMRSRIQDWSGIGPTTHIFTHELAHNAGLFHKPEPFLDDGGLHTDNYTDREDGLAYLARYARGVMGGE